MQRMADIFLRKPVSGHLHIHVLTELDGEIQH